MNPDDITRLLDELGKRLQPVGQEAWNLLITQMRLTSIVWGITHVLIFVIIVSVSTLSLRYLKRKYSEETHYDKDQWVMLIGIVVTTTVISDAYIGYLVIDSLLHFLLPEYYVIMNLINAVK